LPVSPSTATPSGGRILLVEDNDIYRQVVVAVLEQHLGEYEIIEAASVAEARAALRSSAIKVVVTDMTLPDGSAIDLIDRSPEFTHNDIKVVVFSNHSREDMLPVLDHSRVHSYVEKAHGLKVLGQAVLAAIHHEPHALPLHQ